MLENIQKIDLDRFKNKLNTKEVLKEKSFVLADYFIYRAFFDTNEIYKNLEKLEKNKKQLLSAEIRWIYLYLISMESYEFLSKDDWNFFMQNLMTNSWNILDFSNKEYEDSYIEETNHRLRYYDQFANNIGKTINYKIEKYIEAFLDLIVNLIFKEIDKDDIVFKNIIKSQIVKTYKSFTVKEFIKGN